MEPDRALGYEEGFVVHFVPVGGGAGGVGWDGEFGGADAVVFFFGFGQSVCRSGLIIWDEGMKESGGLGGVFCNLYMYK